MKETHNYLKVTLKFFYYPLFTISVGFIFGSIVAEYMKINLFGYFIFIFMTLCLALVSFRSKNLKIILLLLLSIVFGIQHHNNFFDRPANFIANFSEREVVVTGKVKFDPDVRANNVKIVVDSETIEIDGIESETEGLILVTSPRYPVYRYGDKIKLKGVLLKPEPFEEFDYRDYLRTQNIETIMRTGQIERLENNDFDPLQYIAKSKYWISDRMKKALPEPHSSLVLGILIGTKENMPDAFEEDLSVTSTTHIIAVSGYNVSVMLAVILSFAGKVPRKLTVILAYLILFLFMFLVGLNNLPAMRASIMGFAFLTSQVIGRRGGIVSFLPLSAAILVFMNPLAFKSISFQLSFFSTLGLIFLNDKIESSLRFIPEIFRKELAPTFAATFATMPIIIYNFGTVSLISPIVNMLVLPVVPLVMFVGAIFLPTLFLSTFISRVFGIILFIPLDYMIKVIERFGRLGFTQIVLGDIGPAVPIFFLMILIYLSFKFNVQKVPQNKV